tara:strand:- start:362 stop:556 length:195 start_codon:yes stop_codon:yes gene_type:complete
MDKNQQMIIVLIMGAVLIAWLKLNPKSWEKAMRKTKRLRNEDNLAHMVRKWYGWEVEDKDGNSL